MNRYPDHKTYEALYSRYINGRDASELLQLLEPLDHSRFLDLCCGEGHLTLKALEAGASAVIAVDAEPEMMAPVLAQHSNVRTMTESVYEALKILLANGESFDRIVCRQAVNYWLTETTAELTARVLNVNGLFAFNTFNQKPSKKPRVLHYELENQTFVEVSWLIGDTVHHLQVREGMIAHHTKFRWLSPEQIHTILDPFFIVKEERRGKTSLYRCQKKK